MAKESDFKHVELLLDRVIIEKIPVQDEQRASGFTVPAAARQQNINLPKFGTVVAAGPGDPNRNGGVMKVKVGDLVSYQFHSGVPLTMGKTDYMIMREFDIMFIVNKK